MTRLRRAITELAFIALTVAGLCWLTWRIIV